MEFNSAFTDSFCNFHISSSKYAEIKTIKINMYPFFLYHRMISYEYKFINFRKQKLLSWNDWPNLLKVQSPEFNFRCGHPFTTAKVKHCIIEWKYLTIRRLRINNSNQNRFPLDFLHSFTVILPSVTRNFDNSNLPLTRFLFPLRSFLCNFTLDNSNHVFSD